MSEQWNKFKDIYHRIDAVIRNGDLLAAYEQLKELLNEYSQFFGMSHMGIISAQLTLAELCVKIGEEKYEESIAVLEQILFSIGEISPLSSELEDINCFVIDKLASLYSLVGGHRKSIEMSMTLIEYLLSEHTQKNGDIITQDNMSFNKERLNKLISLYLGVGASYSRLSEYIDARRYLEKGYFISHTHYGDEDERTLKLSYNLAANEMQGIDYHEGLRQLRFVCNDMQKYLGDNNEYTLKAKDVLM